MAHVLGIDLGTTNTVVATVKDSRVVVIPDAEGHRLHPSVVAFPPSGEVLLSHAANKRRIIDARNTIFSAKRLIGQQFSTEEVQYAVHRLPYTVVHGDNDQPIIQTRQKRFSVPEISAFVLRECRRCAEVLLDEPVVDAVITVPANFNDGQRAATKAAGRIAGLNVLRVLNEPTAAALAYGCGRSLDSRIAIYDFGGGTFDVTVIQVRDKIFEVLATGGDTFLGGDDIDQALFDLLAIDFLTAYGIDVHENEQLRPRLLVAAEQIKRRLSGETAVAGELKELAYGPDGRPIDAQYNLSRERLEQAIGPLVERTFEAAGEVLGLCGMTAQDVDDIILVGGSTRIPLVRQRVADFFGKAPRMHINPDEVVAFGAAIQAAALAADVEAEEFYSLLLDVTPRALGLAVAGGYTDTLIARNAQIPTEQTRTFTTSADNQQQVKIQVCSGESKRFEENDPLGEIVLEGLRPAPRGQARVEVTFQIDTDGLLHVRARDPDTGREQRATMKVRGAMSEAEIAKAAEAVQASNLPAPTP